MSKATLRTSTSWAYRLVAWIARPLMMIFTRRVWRGTENLDVPGGIIVCGNHYSNFDPLVLAHYLHDNGRPPRFLAKKEIFSVPLIGALIRSAGQIPVHRGTSSAAHSLREAEPALARGEAIVIYPEGTLTYDPDLWPMSGQTGAARLALATQMPVIPVAQWGAHLVIPRWRKGLTLIPPQTMYVTAGEPVNLSDLYGRADEPEAAQLATQRIMDHITALLEEIRGEKAPEVRWDRRRKRESENDGLES